MIQIRLSVEIAPNPIEQEARLNMIIRSRVSYVWLVLLVLINPATIRAMQTPSRGADAIPISQPQDAKQKGVPSPRDVLGFAPGEDRKLADWPQIVDYFKRLDS